MDVKPLKIPALYIPKMPAIPLSLIYKDYTLKMSYSQKVMGPTPYTILCNFYTDIQLVWTLSGHQIKSLILF